MSERPVDIYWSDRSSRHDDMVFRLGDGLHLCDSYWYWIAAEESGGSGTTRDVVAAMFARAAARCEALGEGEWTLHVPFDLSDQCIGWLRIVRASGTVLLAAGWTGDGGHTFAPLQSDFPSVRRGWDELGPRVETTPSILLANLRGLGRAGRAGDDR